MKFTCTCARNALDPLCEVHGLAAKERVRTRKHNQGRSRPLARTSEKQALLNAKWEGIKEAFIFLMNKLDPDGAHCEFCGVPGNEKTLDMHHLRRRGQGGEYSARNGALACNRFNVHGQDNCHDKQDGNVLMWSSSGLEQL